MPARHSAGHGRRASGPPAYPASRSRVRVAARLQGVKETRGRAKSPPKSASRSNSSVTLFPWPVLSCNAARGRHSERTDRKGSRPPPGYREGNAACLTTKFRLGRDGGASWNHPLPTEGARTKPPRKGRGTLPPHAATSASCDTGAKLGGLAIYAWPPAASAPATRLRAQTTCVTSRPSAATPKVNRLVSVPRGPSSCQQTRSLAGARMRPRRRAWRPRLIGEGEGEEWSGEEPWPRASWHPLVFPRAGPTRASLSPAG